MENVYSLIQRLADQRIKPEDHMVLYRLSEYIRYAELEHPWQGNT